MSSPEKDVSSYAVLRWEFAANKKWAFAANEKWDESTMKWVPLELKDFAIKAIKKESNDGI